MNKTKSVQTTLGDRGAYRCRGGIVAGPARRIHRRRGNRQRIAQRQITLVEKPMLRRAQSVPGRTIMPLRTIGELTLTALGPAYRFFLPALHRRPLQRAINTRRKTMKTHRKARLRIVVIALMALVIFPLATVGRAHAYGQGALGAGVIMVWATYLTAKTLVCTPVAAFKASEAEGSFATAFKSCWNWQSESSTAESSTPADQAPQNTPVENAETETAQGDETQPDNAAEAM